MQPLWRVHAAEPDAARALAEAVGVEPVTAQLLLNRGVRTREAASRFFNPRLDGLEPPERLPDLSRGVERLKRAIARREPIVIFSDSDVDGLTASVVLFEALSGLGAVVRAVPSNRIRDGYGMPDTLVRRLRRSSVRLVVLVDCGTNQPDAIRELADGGIDSIVIDHHVPLDGGARPYALINPLRAPGSGGGELCSAGLAFKVAQGLLGAGEERLAAQLDLAALGTLSDCAPLTGDNRPIVSEGLQRIIRSHRPGLQRLCEATQTSRPDPEHILRRLAPRLNASGRLGDASAVWRLLHSESPGRYEEWMAEAEAAHRTTRRLHRQVIAEACEQVNRLHFRDEWVMVVSGHGWHQGLMGLLASRLVEQYGRPAIALALDERRGVGSGRSGPLFNLLEALQSCQQLLVRFGGHPQACGLTVDRKHLDPFRALVNDQAKALVGRQGLAQSRIVDMELPLGAIQPSWIEEVERFAPFGRGNPRPSVVIRRLTVEARSPRRGTVSDGAIRFEATGRLPACSPGDRYDIVAIPTMAGRQPVLAVSDVRASAAP